MSAKVCDSCGEQIIFGRDLSNDKLIPLDNLLAVYEIVEGDKVRFVPKGFRARHRCSRPVTTAPTFERSFSEPKEPDPLDTMF